ncbi:MAG: type II toxin-antitoxin system Phd/YefM family antitoxin, partial [Chitinophagaceae bacterium]|nr:type II toxin-antitoxin system Phd/YefM family antitoxin [Chitinophagaceae bacterium]
MVTENGREAAVMVAVDTWNSLQRRLEILDLVAKGRRRTFGRVELHSQEDV